MADDLYKQATTEALKREMFSIQLVREARLLVEELAQVVSLASQMMLEKALTEALDQFEDRQRRQQNFDGGGFKPRMRKNKKCKTQRPA
jgi:hypothetical protein